MSSVMLANGSRPGPMPTVLPIAPITADASSPATCPACRRGRPSLLESVDVQRLADVWSREWPSDPKPSTECVADWIASDLETSVIRVWRCSECRLEFGDPLRSWSAKHYPAQSHGLGFDQACALRELARQPPASVLEIGCGCGEFLAEADALGHRAIGLDFSAESVEQAQARGVDARLMDLSDLKALQSRPQAFDVVSLFQVIEHLEEPDVLFDEISQLAASDARLFVGCPAPNRFTRRSQHSQRVLSSDFWDFPPQHPLRWNAKALEAFLARHGWRVDSVEEEPFDPAAAAALLVAMDGLCGGWYSNPWRRRWATACRRAELALAGARSKFTGIRLIAMARRVAE